jgi:hypothetical protein
VSKTRGFIDFWVENSVHPAEQFRAPEASQDEARACPPSCRGSKEQGISETDLQAEIGEVRSCVRDKLSEANQAESGLDSAGV